jgi:hypothetical protein
MASHQTRATRYNSERTCSVMIVFREGSQVGLPLVVASEAMKRWHNLVRQRIDGGVMDAVSHGSVDALNGVDQMYAE